MEDLNVVDSINNAGSWLATNQALLLSYAVNIVAAIAIIIVGMIVARVISNTVNRLMRARHIDATVADFLSALVRYGVIAFTLIAALGGTGCGRFGYWFSPAGVTVQPRCWRSVGHLPSFPIRRIC